MITLSNITYKFGEKTILDNFSARLPEHGIVCILGASGSGKTTLLNIILGFLKPETGTLNGLENKIISAVFQEDRLFPELSALENVAVVIKMKDRIKAKNISEEWLKAVELFDDMYKKPAELSGGMKRRVAMARAFAYESDILIMDEPFKGFDDALKKRIFKHFAAESEKRLIIIVTHDIDDCEALNANKIYLKE